MSCNERVEAAEGLNVVEFYTNLSCRQKLSLEVFTQKNVEKALPQPLQFRLNIYFYASALAVAGGCLMDQKCQYLV